MYLRPWIDEFSAYSRKSSYPELDFCFSFFSLHDSALFQAEKKVQIFIFDILYGHPKCNQKVCYARSFGPMIYIELNVYFDLSFELTHIVTQIFLKSVNIL